MVLRSLFISFFISAVLLVPLVSRAQQHWIHVIDAKTGDPVAYAHVLLEKISDKAQTHLVTDEKGKVKNTAVEKSLLGVSYVGFETSYDTVLPGKDFTIKLNPKIHQIDEVVVTAQYAPERADKSIYKVEVINAQQIEQKASFNLTEILSTEMNIRITQDASLGSSMSLQGLSGEHVKILVDGVPVIGRMNGNIDLSQLNLYNVDHIEVIEGPMSVIYGSNAIAGVVNLITKENKSTKIQAVVNSYLESVGIFNFDGSVSYKKKNSLFSLSGGRYFFDGYSDNDTLRYMRWKPKRQLFGDAYYLFSKEKLDFKYSLSAFNEKLQSKGNLLPPYYETAWDTYFTTGRYTNKAELNLRMPAERYLSLLTAWSFYDRLKETFYKDLTTLEEHLSEQDTTVFNSLVSRGTYSKSHTESRLNYQVGFDINYEYGKGEKILDEKQSIGDYAGFLSIKWEPWLGFLIQPGLRLIYNTKYDAPLVYSLNLKWDVVDYLSLRGSYSRGFRAPSLKELYLDFVDANHDIHGNPDLQAENSHNVNLAMVYSREDEVYYYGMDLSLFYNNVNDIIMLVPTGLSLINYTYANISKYITNGVKVDVTYKLYPRLSTKVGAGLTGIYASPSQDDVGKKSFQYSPEAVVFANYKFIKWDFDVTVNYKYSGAFPQVYFISEDELEVGEIGAYNMLDVTAGKDFLKNSLKVNVGVKNLLNVKTIPSTSSGGGAHTGGSGSYPVGYGTTVFLGISYIFNKY